VAGSVPRLAWTPGDTVKEGDVLAEIAPALSPLLDERTRDEAEARLGAALSAEGQARAQVARASAAEQLAKQELLRTRGLVESKAAPAVALEQAEFALRLRHEELASAEFGAKVATEQVRLARSALRADAVRGAGGRHVDVLAPASGLVLRVQQKSAGVVGAGAPLLEVADLARLEIVVDVATTDAVKLERGTPVSIEGWGKDGALAGKVERIEPSAFTRPSALGVDEQRVNVIVAITEPRERWALLGDGYRIEARFVLWQAADVVKVAQGAVFRHGNGWAAFVIEAGRARLVSVIIGHRGEAEVEILSGLAPRARVAVHPGERVADGVRVEVR
jgi:HlyD family secretion protein